MELFWISNIGPIRGKKGITRKDITVEDGPVYTPVNLWIAKPNIEKFHVNKFKVKKILCTNSPKHMCKWMDVDLVVTCNKTVKDIAERHKIKCIGTENAVFWAIRHLI